MPLKNINSLNNAQSASGGHSESLRLLSCGDLRCCGRGVALRSVFQRAETAVQIGQALGYDIRQILLIQIVRRVYGLVVDCLLYTSDAADE